MYKIVKLIYNIIYRIIPTFYYSIISGIPFDPSNRVLGRPRIIKKSFMLRLFFGSNGTIKIGNNFICLNKIKSNSVGLIQPCVFNIAINGSEIIIGNNVGISGSTINASKSIKIGHNVMIGSGCLITDTDSHQINYKDRNEHSGIIDFKPVIIDDDVFIGARSIILKGVTIGRGAVIGAGSVVSKDVPSNAVCCGNPAKVIKYLNIE